MNYNIDLAIVVASPGQSRLVHSNSKIMSEVHNSQLSYAIKTQCNSPRRGL